MQAIALDIHTHLVPVHDAEFRSADGVAWDAAARMLSVDGHTVGTAPLFAPHKLIAWLDASRIAAAWISAPPPLYRQHLGERQAAAWVDRVNKGLGDIAERHAARLTALPHLPIEHPELAADVAGRAIAAGVTRFSAPAGAPGRMLSDAAYDPLWTALGAASAFVLFHPGECEDRRLAPFYLGNLLGNPYETLVAIAHLVFGGIPERFPCVTFCFAHGGGAAAMLAGRFQQGFLTKRPGVDTRRAPPREAMRRMMVDCITHDPTALTLAESVFGEDHIVFGSDWPFPMGLMEPQAVLATLDDPLRARIARANPNQLLKST